MELAFTGCFALAAWQVLGKLHRYVAKVEKRIDDGVLLGDWTLARKDMAKKKERDSAAMGQGASASGHDHIFEDWRGEKLQPAQIPQLINDLAELAQWAGEGQWVPELRGDLTVKPWEMHSRVGKLHLLQAADALEFNFADIVKKSAGDLASNWLWQVTEALPALSAEPVRSAEPSERLVDLKSRLKEAEAAVQKTFDAERRSQTASLKVLVQPLAVAQCMRKMQTLKVLLEEVGLTAAGSVAAAEGIRKQLHAPLKLAAADMEVAAQKSAAEEAVRLEADEVVAAERATRLAQIDTATEATYRRVLTLSAASPSHWHASSTTPALHRLGLLAALLEELTSCNASGTQAGAAAASGLADVIRNLTSQMRVQLTEEERAKQVELLAALTPASLAPPVPALEKAEPVVEESKEESKEDGEGKAEEVTQLEEVEAVPPPPPAPPAPGAAAAELRGLLEGAIRTQLVQSRVERKAARAAAREAAKAEKAAAKAAAKASAAAAAAAATEAAKAAKEAAAGSAPVAAGAPSAEVSREAAEVASPQCDDEAAAAAPSDGEGKLQEEDSEKPVSELTGEEKTEVVSGSVIDEVSEPVCEGKVVSELVTEEKDEPVHVVQQEPVEDDDVEEDVEEPPTAEESVDVGVVQKAVEAEARARAEAEKEEAVMKLQDVMDALHTSTVIKAKTALASKVTDAVATDDAPADAPNAGARLLAFEWLFCGGQGAQTDGALAAVISKVATKLTASDRLVMDATSAASVTFLETAADVVKLTADASKLDMGPGCSDVLHRVDIWLAAQQQTVAAAAERAAARVAKAAAKAEAATAAAAAKAAAEAAAAEAEVATQAKMEAEAAVEPEEEAAVKVETGAAVEPSEAAKPAVEAVLAEEDAAAAVEVAEEEDVEEAPTASPARLVEGRQLVSELLAEGLVLLGLPGPSNKKLQLLRESVDALNPVNGDGAVQNRILTTLKEVVGQLGPIGGSVDARVSQVAVEMEREKLLQVRANAMAIYLALTAFLRLETDTWEEAKADMEQVKKSVYSVKIERRAESLAAGMASCVLVSKRCAALARAVKGLCSPASKEAEAAMLALQGVSEQAQTLSAALNDYISYVRLREHALGVPITAKAELDEDSQLNMSTLDDMMSLHGEGVEWLDLAGLGLPLMPSEEDDEGDREAAKREVEEAVDELQKRLDDWHTTGLRLLARGQVALVTLGGRTVDGSFGKELRLIADVGLPSAKSLLQLGAEKLARLQLLAAESVSGPNSGVAYPLHWFLLVPPAVVEPLTAFLQEHQYFGLLPNQVHVCPNEVRPPLVNEDFKVVLGSSGLHTARGEPGSGEVFLALRRCGALSQLRSLGVRCVEVNAVEDNLLGRPLDPAFVGACTAKGIDAAAKVAVPGMQTEGPSALPEIYSRYMELLGGSSPLLESLGDAVPALGSYYFSMDFVRQADKLLRQEPLSLYRLAPADKVPVRRLAAATTVVAAAKLGAVAAKSGAAAATPAPGGSVAGYRFERRLSDFASPAITKLLGGAVRLAMVAVDAGTEFAPVWGSVPWYRTSPKTAVDALLLQHTRWVEDSGGAMADEEEGVVEVSPLVSYAGEGLAPLVVDKTYEEAYVLELQGFAAQSTGTASNIGLWAVPPLVLYSGVATAKLLAKAIHR